MKKNYLFDISLLKNLPVNVVQIFVFSLISMSVMGQTTYDWQTTAPDGNWKQGIASGPRWNPGGLWDNPPSTSSTILQINNNIQTAMNNNVAAGYIVQKIIFGSSATTPRTIAGNPVQFYEFGATWPRIQNDATNILHSLNFPLVASTNAGFNMELAASAGSLVFGGTITNNGRTIQVYGNNSAIDGTNRYVNLSGVLSGSGALNISQFGVAKLSAAHTYTGQTQIDNGELWIETGGSCNSTSGVFVGNGGQLTNTTKLWLSNAAGGTTFSNNITVNDGNANTRQIGGLNTVGTHTFSGNIANNATGGLTLTALNSGGTTVLSGVISYPGVAPFPQIYCFGSGTLVLSGNSTYQGITNIQSGTLVRLGAAGSGTASPLGNSTNRTIINSGGVLDVNGYTLVTNEDLTISGTGISSGGAMNNNPAVTTNVSWGGLLRLGADASIGPNNGNINFTNAGTITGAGFTLSLGGASGGTLASVIGTTTGGLIKNGTGMWTLTGASTYTGTTTINGGTLQISGGNNRIPVATNLTLANTAGATLDLNNLNQQIGSLNGGGTTGGNVTLGSGTLTVGNTTNTSFDGNINGSGGSIIKLGTGNLTLGGTNTYTGTTITAGTITYNATTAISASGAVNLNSGTLAIGTTPTGTFNTGNFFMGASSIIDLSAGSNAFNLNFAGYGGTFIGTLTINNWTPTANKNIVIPGLTTTQLDAINFNNYGIGAKYDASNPNRVIPKFVYITKASGSGNFSVTTNWLNDDNPLGTSTCAANPATIVIQSGFTLNQDVAYDFLKIDNSGTYNGNAVTITLCTGASFVNNGIVNFITTNVVCSGAATFSGTGSSANFSLQNLTINGATTITTAPTVKGTLQMNSGSSITAALIYSSASTLLFNQGGSPTFGNEWTGNSNVAGLGVPQNVTIQNTTTLNFPASGRGCAGNFNIISSGTVALNSTFGADLYVGGNFTNNGTFTHSSRALSLNGNGAQSLNGTLTGTTTTNCFPYLLINNSGAGVTLNNPVNVTNTLTLTAGLLYLGANNLTISGGNAIAGSPFSVSKMIVADGTGNLIFTVATGFNNTIVYPVGDATGATEYSPLSITINNTGLAGTIGIRLTDGLQAEIDNPSTTDKISRYWTSTTTGINAYTWSAVATYTDVDVVGTEANLKLDVWFPSPYNAWQEYTTVVNAALNTLTSSGGTAGGLDGTDITGRVNQFLYYRTVGAGPSDWANAATWEISTSPAFSTTSPASFSPTNLNSGGIAINSGQTVNTTTSVTADDLTINGILNVNAGSGFVLANGTAATDMSISGTGRLNLNGGAFTTDISTSISVATGGYWNSALPTASTTYNGIANFANGSTYENAANGGTIPPAAWNSNSTAYFTGNITGIPGNLGQIFGNFRWTCVQTADINLGIGTAVPFGFEVAGDLTVENTGATKQLIIFSETLPSIQSTVNIGGKVSVSGGKLSVMNGGSYSATKTVTLNITGDLELSNTGVLYVSGINSLGSTLQAPSIHLAGNLNITNTAQVLQPFTCPATFLFTKINGIQTFSSHGTGISSALVGWGVGDLSGAGAYSNTLQLNNNFITNFLSVFRVYNKATLSCPAELYVSGAFVGFNLYSGATILIASANGITSSGLTGNIRTAGARSFDAGANYTYNGTYNQLTGSGLPATITGSLSIANTGVAGNNTVSLTTNNTTTSKLNLNSGYFAAGTNWNLNISTGGIINGNGGNNPDLPSAGTITFVGSGFTNGNASGNPSLYSVLINGAVDFNGNPNTNSATILNRLQLNLGSSVVDAPFYNPVSTLVYNTTGSYNRNNEWGQVTAGLQGYPYNVAVQNGTFLNLANNPPISLELGGNMDIGSEVMGAGTGQVLMNASTLPLRILGNLTIGTNATTLSKLKLSTEPTGGLVLSGNFTRYNDLNYLDNNVGDIPTTPAKVPVVELNGSANTFVNVYATPNAQNFYNLRMNKTGSGDMTLNCTSLVENTLDLTNGKINTDASNLMTLEIAATVTGSPGSNSFINGPLAKKTSAANTPVGTYEFAFPVGKALPSTQYKPCYIMPAIASGTTTYTGEFFSANAASTYPDPFSGTLVYIYNNHYWKVTRSGAGTARVALDYAPGNLPTDWVASGGSPSPASIPPNTNVAVVKNFGTYWDFTKTPVNFNDQGPLYEARYYTTTGKIYTDVLNSFSPFTFGFDYNTILLLPVKLLSFTGQLVVADGRLNWKIDNARDLDGFELEYSTDGHSYKKLADVQASVSTTYSFLHKQLPAGANYYRLLVRDKKGKTYYSQVVLLNVGKLHTYLVGLTPTVVSELIPVVYSPNKQTIHGIITDVLGRRILSNKAQLEPGSNQWRINTSTLARGMYFISLFTDDGFKDSKRFLKD
jgi:autotransporter-associated beta strand protein